MWAKTFRQSSGGVGSTCSRVPAAGPVATTCCWSRSDRSPRWRWTVAERLRNQGIGVTVVDPRWVLPVPEAIGELARAHKLVVTLEDNGVAGGVGSAVSAALRRDEIDVPCRDVGLPQQFFAHASRSEVLADVGITDRNIARQITGWVAALGATVSETEVSERLD